MSPRLDGELVRRGLVRSRAEAVRAIAEGRVRVDGATASKPASRVGDDADLAVVDPEPWVSRSAHKLIAALDAFEIDPAERLCLDVGASTGGFTQVLLARGARRVIALDVGHDQLVPELREDPRVAVVEGVNVRELDPRMLAELSGAPERPSLIVVDVSFIPLRLVLPALAGVLAADGKVVALVKPQFEVGRTAVRRGLVPDRALRHAAVAEVLTASGLLGLVPAGLIASPIVGGAGNREYLCVLRAGGAGHPTQWERRLADLD